MGEPAEKAAISGEDALLQGLRPWVSRTAGAEVRIAERLPTVRPAWKIWLTGADSKAPSHVLRCGRPPEFGLSEYYSLEREAAIVQALHGAGMPVPALFGAVNDPEALLLEYLPGTSDFSVLQRDEKHRQRVVEHFMRLLAQIHNLSPARLGLEGPLQVPRNPRDHAIFELDIWEALYRKSATVIDPLLAFSLRWLRARAPESSVSVLVQGDTGPNQCLFNEQGITAVLDWELAHLGDPMEDLGWMAARSHFCNYGDLKQLFGYYAEHAGWPLELGKIHYYRVMALVKCAIATGLARASMGPQDDLASILSWDVVNRLSLTWSLLQAMGHPAAEKLTSDRSADDSAHTELPDGRLYDVLSDLFREQAAVEGNLFQKMRLDGLAAIVRYLAAGAADGAAMATARRAEWAALEAKLRGGSSARGDSGDVVALLEGAESVHDADVANYFHLQELRAMALVEKSLGARVSIRFDTFE